MFSERAEIIGKIIAEFVAEIIQDFHLKEDKELLLVKENALNKKILTQLILKFHHQLITLTIENK